MINVKQFEQNLLKIDKKITKGLIVTTLDKIQLKKLMTYMSYIYKNVRIR